MDTPVIVINGLSAPRAAAWAYGRVLAKRGLKVYAARQRWLGYGDVRRSAALVAEDVERVRRETGAARVHLVGMSMGGLIGLYYLKCMGGARFVDRFVSVGGPLRGSSLARLVEAIPFKLLRSIAQTRPGSGLMRELAEAAAPEGVRMFSVGTRGDVVTPRSSWAADGLTPIETPHGRFPLGHWFLFGHPGNQRVVGDLLLAD
jgi:triacylglycerol lipase